MTDTYVIETTYSISYTTKQPVPIPDVIKALCNVEQLLYRTPAFVEYSLPGVRVVSTDVFIDSIRGGSLIKNFLIKYVMKTEKNYEDATKVIERVIEDNAVIRTVVAVGVGSVLTYGVMSALPKNAPSTHIEFYKNNINTFGADANLSGDAIRGIVESITDKKALAKEAVGALAPAHADSSAEVQMSGYELLTFPAAAVAEAPKEYEAPMPEHKDVRYQDVRILISASDRDRSANGWAGMVPEVVDTRTKIILDEGVDPREIHGKTRVVGDVTITSKYVNAKKAFEAKQILIHAINE